MEEQRGITMSGREIFLYFISETSSVTQTCSKHPVERENKTLVSVY
jgi:hypothetical protein